MSQESDKKDILPNLDSESEKLLDDARILYNEFVQGRMRAGYLPGEPDRSPRGQAFSKAITVLEKYQDDPRPLIIIGSILFGMGELAQAENYLKKAAIVGASNLDFHRMLAEIYLEREAFADAEKHIDFIEQHDKTRPEIYELRSEIALRKQDWQSRLDALTKLHEMQESEERFVTAIATTYLKLKKTDAALRILLDFDQNNPDSPEVNFLLGNIYTDMGKASEAKKYYLKTLEFNPDHNMARFELANTLDELGHSQEALQLFREYIGVINDDPDAYYNAAGIAENVDDKALAVHYYLEFLKLTDNEDDFKEIYGWLNENAPGLIEPITFLIGLASAHIEQENPEDALKELKIANDLGLKDRRTLFLEGKANFLLGNYKRAKELYKQANDLEDPGDIEGFSDDEILIAAGDVCLEAEEFDEAVETANELLKGEMEEHAHTLLGDIYLEKEEYDQAKEEFTKAIRINLFSFNGMFGLGEVFDAKGDYLNASTCFRLCLEIEPQDEDAVYRLGMDYYRLGFKDWAKHYLKKLPKSSTKGDYAFEIPDL